MTDTIIIRRITNPTDEEVDSMIAVCVAAYHGDQFTECAVGGDWNLHSAMRRTAIGAQQVGGENWVALHGDKIIAVAGWFPPGRALLDRKVSYLRVHDAFTYPSLLLGCSPEQAAAGWDAFVAKMPPALNQWWTKEFLPEFSQLSTESLGPGVKKDSWHLQTVATHPDYQRRGIATALLRHKEEMVASEGGAVIRSFINTEAGK
ncbi:hypothetical protein BXZ70DRAFT_1011170 [Cristinia sonorae]|uniref:N-acetyltransferase domain-containing protein n=1 Tax=Cristinia sonorae TaxID=1940300 RepID=A0A8K0UI08_9AGAR|nr:hypothetical protein BXZ70DRAFT_1011170 [Cristinia sonorae]